MSPAHDEARRLLKIARRDPLTLSLLAPPPDAPLAAMGFHAQQAVEKSLKALCALHSVAVLRTHDLAALATLLLSSGHELPVSLDQVRELSPFAVEFRYDESMHSQLSRDALIALVHEIVAWASRCIDDALPPQT